MTTIKANATRKKILLTGASALIIGAAMAAGGLVAHKAQAATTTIATGAAIMPFEPSADGWIALTHNTENFEAVSAEAQQNLVSVVDEVGDDGPPSAVTVDGTLIGAFATGTSFINEVELNLIDDPDEVDNPLAEGIGVIGRAINAAPITSDATDNIISVDQTDFENGSLLNADNLITAQTTLNRGESSVHGTVPNGYESSIAGTIELNTEGIDPPTNDNVFESEATVAVTSSQINLGIPELDFPGASGSYALTLDNAITMTVQPDDVENPIDVDGSMVLDRNAITAAYRGNTATTNVSVEEGGDPAFSGSIAVANLQTNLNVALAEDLDVEEALLGSAMNIGSTINATIGTPGAEDSSALAGGTLSVSDNTISSSAVGNEALATNDNGQVAGNQIVFDDQMSFFGPGNGAPGSSLEYDTGDVAATVDADLGLLNHQANVGSPLVSVTAGGEISADVQDLSLSAIDTSGNRVSSRAVGNAATNAILAPGPDGNNATFDGTAAIASGQVNFLSDITATTIDNTIQVTVGNPTEDNDGSGVLAGSVNMIANALGATAIGNQVGNTLAIGGNTVTLGEDQELASITGGMREPADASSATDDATLAVGAGATVLSVQSNYSGTPNGDDEIADITASNINSTILLTAGDITDDVESSSLIISGRLGPNTVVPAIEATAVGSSGSNVLDISATNLTGSAGLGNVQDHGGGIDGGVGQSRVLAEVVDPTIRIEAGTVTGDGQNVDSSSVEVSDNWIRALAWSTTATNTVTVDATTTTVPNDDETGTTLASQVNFDADGTWGRFFAPEEDPGPPPVPANPTVTAAFGLLSVQDSNADVSALISGEEAQIAIHIGDPGEEGAGNVIDSSIVNDGNALIAAATGSQATNAMDLELGTLSVADGEAPGEDSEYVPIGNVTNVQTQTGAPEIEADISSGDVSIETVIADDVTGSSVSVSENVLQAEAHANRSRNTLTASGTTIAVAPNVPDEAALTGLSMDLFFGDGSFDVDAAFSVQNVQSGADSVSATLGGQEEATVGALLDVGGNVNASNLAVDDNAFIAAAYNNRAVNELDLSATTLGASSGIQSFQVTSSNTHASTGEPGTQPTPATEDDPFEVDVLVETLNSSCASNVCTFLPGTNLEIDKSDLTPEQIQALIDQDWDDDNGTLSTQDLNIIEGLFGTTFTENTLSTGDTVEVAGLVPGEPADPGSLATKSVLAAIGGNSGDIIGSSVSVDGTLDLATAVSNDVVNALSAEANNLDPATGTESFAEASLSIAPADPDDPNLVASADHAVSNYQVLAAAGTTSAEAAITLGIMIDPDDLQEAEISGSSLTVDGNIQQAIAVGNRANSTIDLAATNTGDNGEDGGLGATSALMSLQSAREGVLVTADAWTEAFAPGGIEQSSLSISGNEAMASATVNQATNTSNVSATNMATALDLDAGVIDPGNASASTEILFGDVAANADHALNNVQFAFLGTAATGTAEMHVYNQEFGGASDSGLDSSSVQMNANVAEASATGNQAANALNLSADATMSATGALANRQLSFASVDATATGTVRYLIDGAGTDTVQGSSIAVDDNRVVADARGNSATNALNVEVGAGFANLSEDGASASSSIAGGTQASASYAALNHQTNFGPVTASVTGALNVGLTGGSESTLASSAVTMSNNRYEARATGNFASNTMTMSALPTGNASMALASTQRNFANVTATASGVDMTVSATGGGKTGSSTVMSGNRITASATGNSAVNRIGSSSF